MIEHCYTPSKESRYFGMSPVFNYIMKGNDNTLMKPPTQNLQKQSKQVKQDVVHSNDKEAYMRIITLCRLQRMKFE